MTTNSAKNLRWMARQAATGDPEAVLLLLSDFAADNPGKPITALDLWQHPRNSGHEPRRMFADERIGPRLEELQQEFDDSISQHLAGGKVLVRPEVKEVLSRHSCRLCGESTGVLVVIPIARLEA